MRCSAAPIAARPVARVRRLRQGEREEILPVPDTDIRAWLPGDVWIDRVVDLPAGFQPGWADIAVGLRDPAERQARILFANKETFGDRWLDLGGIALT